MLREGKEGLGDFEKRGLGAIENLQDIFKYLDIRRHYGQALNFIKKNPEIL